MSQCLSPDVHSESPTVFAPPPDLLNAASARPVQKVALAGKLELFLHDSRVEHPIDGAAGWFADKLGMFAKQTEPYSTREFLEKYSTFLSQTNLRNVILIEIDYTAVFLDRENKTPDDLDQALTAAYQYLLKHLGSDNKIVISTLGKTRKGLEDDLDIVVEAQFYHRHGFGKPGMMLNIVAIPSKFVKQEKETKPDYEERLRQLTQQLEDNKGRAALETKYTNVMKEIIADYKQHLAMLFNVERDIEQVIASWDGTGKP